MFDEGISVKDKKVHELFLQMIMKNIETIANSKKYLEEKNVVDIIEQNFEHSAEASGSTALATDVVENNDGLVVDSNDVVVDDDESNNGNVESDSERANRYFSYPNNRQVVPPVVIIAMGF